MRRTTIALLACMAFLSACAGGSKSGSASGSGDYLSSVYLEGLSGERKLTGRIGDHLSSRIGYQIGWHTSDRHGTPRMTRAAVENPEYMLFGDGLPRGLTFDPATGRLSGTPQQSGVWRVTPAVRDRVNGETPYRGRGFWWTTYTRYQGKTWIQAENPTTIEIQR
ncbi:MAG: Ig domain-containing protein [Betaproteobacteria bacterium]